MPRRPVIQAAGFSIALGILTACSTTSMYKVERHPEFDSGRIHKVMVISLTKNEDLRKTLEDEFVKQWRKRKVDAYASYQVLPPGTPLEKATVAPLAKQGGYDTAIVTRLLARGKVKPETPNYEFDTEMSSANANMTQYFQTVTASPEYASNYEIAAVVARVYDVATEKLMWSGTSQTLLLDDVRGRIQGYVKVILKALYEKT